MFQRRNYKRYAQGSGDVGRMFKKYKSNAGLARAYMPYVPAAVAENRRMRRRNVRTAGFLGIEKKFYDTLYNQTAVATTAAGAEADPAGNLKCLNAITQGDGESSRDGRRCIIKSIQVKGFIDADVKSDLADVSSGKKVRVLLVLDKQTNAAQLNSEDVLKDAATIDMTSLRNLQYSQRFKVLHDRVYTLTCGAAGTDGANTNSMAWNTAHFNIFKNVNIPVNYTGTTEDIANIVDNSLHIIAVASTTGTILCYQSRVRFVG